MRAAWAILVRDFRGAWSYRFSFLVQNVSIIFTLVSLKFVATLFGGSTPRALEQYGGDYFSFALVGAGISVLSYPAVKTFAGAIRSAQVTGTLEVMLATRTSPAVLVLSSGIYPILSACLQLVLMAVVGGVVLGAGYQLANLGLVILVLIMTIASLTGIGLMSAAFVVAFKQQEPFSGALIAASLMISGILYPTSVLPPWLGDLAPLLPITHAIALTRGLLLEGAAVPSQAVHFAALAAYCLLLPAGLALLDAAIRWAKQTGSLAHY